MASKGSFFTQGSTVYTETNPPGPATAPVAPSPNEARSSFFASGGQYAAIDQTALYLSFSVAGGVLLSSEWLFGYTFDVPATFPVNLTGSQAKAGIAATNPSALSLRKNGVEFATITFTGTTATFSAATVTSFAIGDLLEVYGPATADSTLAHVSATLFATQTT